MARFARSAFFVLVLWSTGATADIAPEPAGGRRFLERAVVVDASGVAPECAIVQGMNLRQSPLTGPLAIGKFTDSLYCAPNDDRERSPQALEALGR